MAILDFYKGTYAQIAITITSNEVLGILDTDYIEDYYGVDGQISLFHAATNTRYPVLMTAVVPKRQFTGFFQLATAPLGTYQVQGKVQDTVGNVTVMGAVESGTIGEAITLGMNIKEGNGPNTGGGPLILEGVDREKLTFHLKVHEPLVMIGRQLW